MAAIIVATAVASPLTVACGDDSAADPAPSAGSIATAASAAPSSVVPIPRPRDLVTTSGAASVTSPPGSYCWDIACADALADVTTTEVLSVARGDVIRMSTPHGAPQIAEVQVFGVVPRSVPVETREDGLLAWLPTPGSQDPLPFTLDAAPGAGVITTTAGLAPGEYVLSLFTIYAEPKGDASYTLQLDVR